MDEDAIIITQEETKYDFGHGVVVSMSTERARVLREDLDRIMSLVSVGAPNLEDNSHPNHDEQEAYNRLNALLEELHEQVSI